MNDRLLQGIQKTAGAAKAASSVGGYLNQVFTKKAEATDTTEVTRKSENTTPSSSTSDGMEDRNKTYGKGSEDTDFEKKTKGQETGKVKNRAADKNVTTEAEGIPADSEKTAAQKELRRKMLVSKLHEHTK